MQPEHDNNVKVEYRGTGFYVSLAIIFLAAVTLLILAVQNTGEVTIEILALEFDLPLFAVILGTALIAVILDELIGVVWRRQQRTRLEERAELQRLRAEHEARIDSATMAEESADESDHQPGEPDLATSNDIKDPFRPDENNSPT
jgi:uncharacterized integral membrane protein